MSSAISACTVLPGNTRVCVNHTGAKGAIHRSALAKAINHDGGAHGAAVKGKALEKLTRALHAEKADAWFPVVGGEVAGGSIEFASVLTKYNGKEFEHYPAIYGEDTSVYADVSKTVRERTKSPENPKGIGLGTWFEDERIRHWTQNAAKDAPFGLTPAARIGEYSPHSAAMISIFKKLGAKLGTEGQGIKEVDGHSIVPAWPVDVETNKFQTPGGKDLSHIFLTQWASNDGKQKVVATFTEGLSTFTGDPVIRVQVTSNGNLPGKGVLKDVLASLLVAGQNEIDKREWGKSRPITHGASPVVSLGGSDKELQTSAFAVAGEEVARQTAPVSLMRIHSFEDGIVDALPGRTRLLGAHAMRPVVVDFANIPQDILDVDVNPAKPLVAALAVHRGITLH